MNRILYIEKWIFIIIPGLLTACASIKEPSGGPKDKKGPELISTSIPNKSIRFKEKSLAFTFNEFLDPDNIEQAIFFSPLIEPPPEIFTTGRVLHIKFKQKLKPNATYVITLGKDIRDFNEKNPLAQTYHYAFSTGEILDTLSIRGNIKDAYSLKPIPNFLVLLFEKDSAAQKGVFKARPQYIAQTDSNGFFEFLYIKPGVYRILGIEDKDRSFSYNLLNEKVAQPIEDTLINVEDPTLNISMLAFIPDSKPPRIKKIEWLNLRNISINFTEPVTGAILIHSDSSQQLFLNEHPNGNKNALLCPILELSKDSIYLRLREITDTAGNKSDTVLWQKVPLKLDSTFQIKELPARDHMPLSRFFQTTAFLQHKSKSYIIVQDSTNKKVNFNIEIENYTVGIHASEKTDTLMPYQIIFQKGLSTNLSWVLDTTFSFTWRLPSTENLGSIKGKIISSVTTPLLVILETPTKKRILQKGPFFHFKYLPPGNYQIGVIEDEDKNNLWSPGLIFPYKKVEKVYYYPKPISLLPGWEVENYEIFYPPPK